MLKKVIRHGFVYWEAPTNPAPARRERPDLYFRLHNLAGIAEASLAPTATAKTTPFPAPLTRRHAPAPTAQPEELGGLIQFSDAPPAPAPAPAAIPTTRLPSSGNLAAIAQIQTQAMQAFGVTRDAFFSQDAKRNTVWARIASMALCHQFTDCTQKQIADAHQRNDAVVCRALLRLDGMRQTYPAFDAKFSPLQQRHALPRLAAA